MATPTRITGEPVPDIEQLQKDLATAVQQRDEARAEAAKFEADFKDQRGEVFNLREFIARADEANETAYVLEPILPGNPCSRYDGLVEDGVCIWHEAITFANDAGYDRSVLYDRAKGCVDRALGADSGDRILPDCSNLPPFNKANAIEVIVRIIPKL